MSFPTTGPIFACLQMPDSLLTTGLYADDSSWPIPVIVAVVIAILFFIFLLRTGEVYPYEKIEHLCTQSEWKFYRQLLEIVGDKYPIFSKVRIADLLKVKKGTRQWLSWQNKINCKHIDFVLCDPERLEILIAIELDDRSHEREDRVKRDRFVNRAFEDARLPILRIRLSEEYDRQKIGEAIAQCAARKNKSYVIHIG